MHALDQSAVELPTQDARKAFLDYRDAVRDRRQSTRIQEAEDREMMRAYREAAKGTRIIRLSATLAAGGTTTIEVPQNRWSSAQAAWVDVIDTVRVPRLAVGRADCAYVWTNGIYRDGSWRLQFKRDLGWRNTRDRMAFPVGTFPASTEIPDQGLRGSPRINALLPPVPPSLRPKTSHLRNFHVLWEVDQWQIAPGSPPGDPALLKHLGGDLYAVVAVWDLTELERAVLHGRRPAADD